MDKELEQQLKKIIHQLLECEHHEQLPLLAPLLLNNQIDILIYLEAINKKLDLIEKHGL